MKRNYAVAIIVAASLVTAGGSAMAFGGHKKGDDRGQMRFEQLDTNKDGKLSLEEMQAGPAARFAEGDTNGDGKISADEAKAAGSKRAEKRFAKMLERHDADKDGALSMDELKDTERQAKHAKMFEKLDADEDGFLSKDELAKMRGKGKDRDDRKKRD
ncbi:EF-hand domain-containing protein [Lentibacter sp. XHP0401]|uniref:EF-hand domain-containing protein n=1 Tax=Lentibacter sp. XHP0401 TaxID=2984334 RepID=UPI0021E802D5|nr:calcium-binding protein [Lentibacter sp. XHP0401]MCV2893008.1 calcium-binding protein [Lentibacter sp. XHP0401]